MIITMNDITRVYTLKRVEIHALRGVSLSIQKGEFVVIIGPSGSGKSTIMHIIGCLDRPTSGIYKLENIEIAGLSDNELSEIRNKKIGFVFQTFNLIPRMSVLKNVALPMIYGGVTTKERYKKTMEVISQIGLSHRVAHRPSELSGGEQQRVAIARALVNNPSLLLADEPTGNLDSQTGEEIMKIFQELNQSGVTIILVTHEEKVAKYATRIISLRDGMILSDRKNV
ncbi:MAG: ABC transporter ATP-binding protein [bacterium]